MSASGVEDVKQQVRDLLIAAAANGLLTGEEPLAVLTACATKMVAEIRDADVRDGMIRAIEHNFRPMVAFARGESTAFRHRLVGFRQ